jgi:hypothetical protein
MALLSQLGLETDIVQRPNELEGDTAFPADEANRAYDPEYANRFWRVLLQSSHVMEVFRSRFVGKASPVHFFWGNTDIATTRFSGRRAPRHPGGRPHLPDAVLRDAYSQECTTCGFWPGGTESPHAVFYCEAWPQPPGFADAHVRPAGAHYSRELKEFVFPYAEARKSASPEQAILEFFQSTYKAVAERGQWDRAALERPDVPGTTPPCQ